MRTTTLGRTGPAVSPIAFGTWELESAAIEAIRNARCLEGAVDQDPDVVLGPWTEPV